MGGIDLHHETSAEPSRGGFQRLLAAVRGNRKLEIAVYGGVALLVVLLYAGSLSDGKAREASRGEETAQSEPAVYSEALMEEKLAAVLSSIRGAGRVEVMITFDTGTELVPAMSTNVNSDSSESSDGGKTSRSTQVNEVSEPATVSGSGGNEPIVLLEKQPVVRGVVVVAEGAADVRVKLDLQRAVEAVLDVPPTRIEVFERGHAAE